MSKNISFNTEKMISGLDIAAEAVGSTIGPKGRNVFVGDAYTPKITNDGATIANKISLKDKEEDAGAYIIRNVSAQQLDDVGDGTTTVSVLTHAIIHECLKRPENKMEIRESLIRAKEGILKDLKKRSIKIEKNDIERVALISAEDKNLAKLIALLIDKLGNNAVINVEDSRTPETEYDIVDGYEAPVGFISPNFINDKKTGKAIYNDVPVLVSEKKIASIQDIASIFDQFKQKNINQCVIACEEIDDSILGVLAVNKNMGIFNSLVIRANIEILRDIEGATGARAISDANGITFQNISIDDLGKAKKIVCDANKSVFVGSSVHGGIYAKELEKRLENEQNIYLHKKLQERIARLKGKIGILKIGAYTDQEREYLKDKADDAVKATLAAIEEGIVEGGGITLWRISQNISPKTVGEEILKRSLTAPLKRIISNAGKDYAEIMLKMPLNKGYDAKNDSYVDMIKEGIIDPSKVERCAIENSISAASTFITTNAIITEETDGNTAGVL